MVTKAKAKEQRRVIGYIGVDAGMCYLGDPCYVIGRQLGADYGAFLSKYCPLEQREQVFRIPYRWGEGDARVDTPQQAIVVGTGYGDGKYPVEAVINDEGRVLEVRIRFADDEDE